MGPGMFDGLDKLLSWLMVCAVIGMVLSIVEVVRLVWWAWNHLAVSIH